MLFRENIADIDLNTGTVHRSFQNMSIGEGDEKANRYGVRIVRNGEPVTLSGVSVVGYFIRSDGSSVVISGSVNGNIAYVDLPEACYVYDGNFTLSIKLATSNETATIRIVDGTVVNTVEGSIIDPGSVVPDLSAFTALVEAAEAAAEVIEGFSISEEQITGTRYKIIVTDTNE